jgi:hypothetical protein
MSTLKAKLSARFPASVAVVAPMTLTQSGLTYTFGINQFTSAVPGVVPASGGGTANFMRADGTWAVPPSGIISDGDKGDITVTSGVWTIDPNVVTNAKLAQIATQIIKGRKSAAAGNVEDITVNDVLDFVSGVAGAAQGDMLFRTSGGLWKRLAAATAGWVLSTNGAGADPSWITPPSGSSGISGGASHGVAINSGATTIGGSVVLGAGALLIGVASADPTTLALGTANQVLRVNPGGTALGYGSIDLSQASVVGSSALGPTNGGTGQTTYTLGDMNYASAANVLSKLAGNTTSTKKFLRQTGTGSVSAAPAWDTVVPADIGFSGNWKVSYTDGSGNLQTVALGAAGTALVSTGASAAPTAQAVLQPGVTSTITVGYAVTPNNIGTVTTGTTTLNPALGNYQYMTNNGASTIAAPASDCPISVLITNGASAGALTFSGFTVGSNTGDALDTTNAHKFVLSVVRINAVSTYTIKALQ